MVFVAVCIGLILWAVMRSDRDDHAVEDAMAEKPLSVPTGD
jgi:hypothetical protein